MDNDLISRSALLDELKEQRDLEVEVFTSAVNNGITTGLRLAIKIAKTAPAVDAEPVKHGKPNPHIVQWFGSDGEVILEDQVGWECPFCGEDGVKNYCHNCGAKMDLEG